MNNVALATKARIDTTCPYLSSSKMQQTMQNCLQVQPDGLHVGYLLYLVFNFHFVTAHGATLQTLGDHRHAQPRQIQMISLRLEAEILVMNELISQSVTKNLEHAGVV